jgi:hypothetical protein
MTLSELVTHTSAWIGVSRTIVESHARYLREDGLLTSGGRGLAAPSMNADDCINLLLGVCGTEQASHSAEHVRAWRRMIRAPGKTEPRNVPIDDFAFPKSAHARDLVFDLIARDLNGGPLDAWLTRGPEHEITLDFHVNEFALTVAVSRTAPLDSPIELAKQEGRKGPPFAAVIEARFAKPKRGAEDEYLAPRTKHGYLATSQLIRRLNAHNLRGWGTCLTNG